MFLWLFLGCEALVFGRRITLLPFDRLREVWSVTQESTGQRYSDQSLLSNYPELVLREMGMIPMFVGSLYYVAHTGCM